MMTKWVTSVALGLGLLLPTGSAVQAGGLDQDDIARAIFGIATVAIIAKAIDDRGDRKKADAKSRKHHERRNEYTRGPASGARVIDGRIRSGALRAHAPKAHRGYKAAPLPAHCRVIVETQRGDRPAFGRRCLTQSYKFASKLPGACETLVRIPRGYRSVYGSRCLDRDGWKVSQR